MKKVKLLALISAVITGLLLFAFLNAVSKPAETEKTNVIVAAADIPANTPITPEMIATAELPAESIVSGALSDSSAVVGKVAQETIYSGEQILGKKLIQAGDTGNGTLAYALEPGSRAMSISVDETSGIAYMIVPGNYVDIMAYFLQDNGTTKTSYTTMILENIKVLAVDNVMSDQGKTNSSSVAYTTLTLQVTPKQAMELSMAQSEGQLTAILRSPLDDDQPYLPSVQLNNIMVK